MERATSKSECNYHCYVTRGEGYLLMCVKATILLYFYISIIGEIGLDFHNIKRKKEKRAWDEAGLTSKCVNPRATIPS